MLFNSTLYLIFLTTVSAIYFALPGRARLYLLLLASYVFYSCWRADYLALILAITVVNYGCALGMGRHRGAALRKVLLGVALVGSLGLLAVFKYAGFFSRSFGDLADLLSLGIDLPRLDVLLPVGISFYTLQAVGYSVDVYRGRIDPERHPFRYALYVAFFPQLVAGPIERGERLLPQLHMRHRFSPDRIWDGMQLIAWGLFKKVVVADRLGMYVDAVYGHVYDHEGPTLLLATYFFTVQIYCDFSGYTDIAIGSARILGINLVRNFDLPYFATTIRDHWRRWHISLSSWLRDYVYIPLGGNRQGAARTLLNLFLTMVIGGLWHGANWTFVLWGGYHGVLMCGSWLTQPWRDRFWARLGVPLWVVNPVRALVTFHLIVLGFVLFRSRSLAEAFHIFSKLPELDGGPWINAPSVVLGAAGIAVLFVVQLIQTRFVIRDLLAKRFWLTRWVVYASVVFAIIVFGVDAESRFIYFQF